MKSVGVKEGYMKHIKGKKAISVLLVITSIIMSMSSISPYTKAMDIYDDGVIVNTNLGIKEEHFFDDLRFWDAKIVYDTNEKMSCFTCSVTNEGEQSVYGTFDIIFYNSIYTEICSLAGYVGTIPPGETRTIVSYTSMDMGKVYSWVVIPTCMNENKVVLNGEFLESRFIQQDVLGLYNIEVYSYLEGRWLIKCYLTSWYEDLPNYFQVKFQFKDETGGILLEKETLAQVKLQSNRAFIAFSTDKDLSQSASMDVTTDFVLASAPVPTSTPTPTVKPRPKEETSESSELKKEEMVTPTLPNKDMSVSKSEFKLKGSDNKVKISWNKLKEDTRCIIYRSTKKNNGYKKIATIQNKRQYTDSKLRRNKTYYYRIQIDGKSISDIQKWVVPAIKTPSISISVSKKTRKLRVIRIKINKYGGKYVEIFYWKGKFKKIKLKQNDIKKNKKIFKIGYKKKNKKLLFRVRTYQWKDGKKVYSDFSKSKTIMT